MGGRYAPLHPGLCIRSNRLAQIWLKSGMHALPASLRIVDVRGIMACACAKQWAAHAQGNGLHMCKAMACAWGWFMLNGHVQGNCVRVCKAIGNWQFTKSDASLVINIKQVQGDPTSLSQVIIF